MGLPGFSIRRPVIGMIHVGALPGTPAAEKSLEAVESTVRREAGFYRAQGVHGIMLENMHDTPFVKGAVGPEIVAAMTRMALAAKEASDGLPCGIQILAAANREALAVALAAGLHWIRAEGFVFGHVADEGYIDSSAGDLMRYRRMIGADGIQVWADIKKKHSAHAVTADVSLAETAKAAAFFRADAVVVTGAATGEQPAPEDLIDAKRSMSQPVLLGSGITPENLHRYADADGFIVGSYFKTDGYWANSLDPRRIGRFMDAWQQLPETPSHNHG